ncbi:preprotein translocase subunit SecE [Schaalia meyeri]|uniref:Protein translocase subunit SecE n=1 Tax=Schaalia meyeri TaxID=52773 RepID=A0AAQ0BVY2_9ACTO|nr:preprotein translocase subunit SecE [Schaalia meyeri]OFQ23817.1 preprotein translocase subunit SecE [Actinomyces sp. HMSC062G12]QQC43945.1 preprotein translocase subunit SecE [Schaalia meyeri]SDR78655.1 preprotein translocase subunit SecE [Schaalia meyeri]
MAASEASDVESSRRDRTKNEATPKRGEAAREKTKRPGFFGRIWLFFKQVIDEMKKVTYPTGSETWTYFTVVVVFVTAIMIFAGLLDFGFGKLSALIFG